MTLILKAIRYFVISLFIIVNTATANDSDAQIRAWQNNDYLISGIYYLIIQNDQDRAEQEFQKAILVSSIESLSTDSDDQNHKRYVIAESLYFLGKIYYDKSFSKDDIQGISKAKGYLERAEKYGIIYDRLHPKLLDKINLKYPNVKASAISFSSDNANVIFEIDDESFRLDSIKINRDMDISRENFTTNKQVELDGGARYKLEPNIKEGYRSIYKALTMIGIGLVIWIARG